MQSNHQYQTVFITGVSTGLGYGLARELLETGARVYGVSRRQPDIDHPNFHFASLDLSEFHSISSILLGLLNGVQRLDLAILNAGMLGDVADLQETDLEQMKHVMDVNVWSNKILIDTLLGSPLPLDQVVAISSGASVSGSRGWSGYGVSKAALNMLIKLYAAEAPETHFTALAPGLIHSAMQDYINSVPDPVQFPTVERLRRARGTDEMPEPLEAARHIVVQLPHLYQFETGSFQDLRKL